MRPLLDLLCRKSPRPGRSISRNSRCSVEHRTLRAEALEERTLLSVSTGTPALAAEAANTAPSLWIAGMHSVSNGAELSIPNVGLFSDPDTGHSSFTGFIDWDDGTAADTIPCQIDVVGAEDQLTWGTFDGAHTFTAVGRYEASFWVTDDEGAQSDVHPMTIDVTESVPQNLDLEAVADTNEGQTATLRGTFEDTGNNKSHTVTVSWGDGTSDTETALTSGARSFEFTHNYEDDGPNPGGTSPASATYTYPISVTVTDNDSNSIGTQTTVDVHNLAPSVSVIGSQQFDEGWTFDGKLSDYADLGVLDTHTATIDWGDGTATAGVIDSTAKTISGTHTYQDENRDESQEVIPYTVTVTLTDDDTGTSTDTISVLISNVAPTLDPIDDQEADEGQLVSFGPTGFADPGVLDTHTASVDWGDGTITTATVDQNANTVTGSHTFGDDGTYSVVVTLSDNGGDQHSQTFQVVVSNVAPTLSVVSDQTASVGSTLEITNIGSFSDPGFGSPNATPPTAETFTYQINWGDGTTVDNGVPTIDVSGAPGVETQGSFDGSHVYATSGEFTVSVTVADNDKGQDTKSFLVTVSEVVQAQAVNEPSAEPTVQTALIGPLTETEFLVRSPSVLLATSSQVEPEPVTAGPLTETEFVAQSMSFQGFATALADTENATPILGTVGNRTLDEGQLSIVSIGAFLDYDSQGPFPFSIDWGDGAAPETGTATITGTGPPTTGTFNGNRLMDDDLYVVAFSLSDEHGNSTTESVYFTIENVAPTADPGGPYEVAENGAVQLQGEGYDPAGDLDPLTFEWDLDDDQIYGETGTDAERGPENVQNPVFSATGLSGPQSWPVRLRVLDDDGGVSPIETTSVLIRNVAPTIENLQIVTPVDEGNKSTVSGVLVDPSIGDVLSLEIDWGDGTPVDTYTGLAPATSFSYEHVYEDDGLTPGGSPSHDYDVSVTVSDNAEGSTPYSLQVQVDNISPMSVTVEELERVNENEEVTLRGTFAEPGVLDTHVVTIVWGDGIEETVDLTLGDLEFEATHRYLDDGLSPGGTVPASGTYTYPIEVTVQDDDTGTGTAATTATVDNVAPVLAQLSTVDINENEFTTLSGEIVDPGTLDTFVLALNWNDQTATQSIPFGTDPIDAQGITWNPETRQFTVEHRYLDDGLTPGGAPFFNYQIDLTVTDDDTGSSDSQTTVRVTNTDPTPTITGLPSETVFEGAPITLTSQIADPGTLDTFTYAWSVTRGGLPYDDGTGDPTDQAKFTFLPDDDGDYQVTLRVTDDDTGNQATSADIAVENAPPVAVDDHYQFDGVGVFEVAASGILANDYDPGDDLPLRAVNFSDLICTGSGADCGTLIASEDGSFSYEPVEDFSGTVGFTYYAMDQDDAVSANPATVSIDVGMNSTISGYVYAVNQDAQYVPDQLPLPGVFVTLEAVDEKGTVRINGITDDNGYYEFTSLRAGTYRVTERQPAAILDGGQHEQTVTIRVNEENANNNFAESWLRPQQISIGIFLASNLDSPSNDFFWPSDLREQIAQAEEDAGNHYEAAAIRHGKIVQAAQRGAILSLTGTELPERFVVEPGTTGQKVTVWSNGFERTYEAAVDEVFTLTILGGGGSDEARLYDSTRSDLLEGRYNFARLINDRFLVDLFDFDRIRAISQSGGNDRTSIETTIDYLLTLEGPWDDGP